MRPILTVLILIAIAAYDKPAFSEPFIKASNSKPTAIVRHKAIIKTLLPRPEIWPETPPPNDLCENAESISSPYPVSGEGSSIDATIDCPTLLNLPGVWYATELPYEYNDILITLCGLSEDIVDVGIVLMDDCDCDNYVNLTEFRLLDEGQCPGGFLGFEISFNSISRDINPEGRAYLPIYIANDNGQGTTFAYSFDISESQPPPMGDLCENPLIITGLPFADSLNSCDFNNDYNFGGKDVVYRVTLNNCMVLDISLCNTSPVFDTYMLLYDESSCGGGPIATNDDGCMPPGQYGTSTITDTLEAGIYYIIIDAYSGVCGQYILNVAGRACPVPGACCLQAVCIGTMYESSCDSLGGEWFESEDCQADFICPGGCSQYLPGDINMYNASWPPQAIGSDVTYLVNYFRGLLSSRPCLIDGFWCSADANGDCNIIGSDVTRMVNYFRGIAALGYCPDHIPCWPSSNDLPAQAPQNWPDCAFGGR